MNFRGMAVLAGVDPATSPVTGERSTSRELKNHGP